MPRLPDPRDGKELKIRNQNLEFSYWPMKKNSRRFGLQSRVFISDPWGIIRHSIEKKCPLQSRTAALAFCDQAEDYFKAANVSGVVAAKPVLLYYCLLNIAKAFVLVKKVRPEYGDSAYHGLAERVTTGGKDLIDSYLKATPSGRHVNVFDDFLKALNGGTGLSAVFDYKLMYIMPQILHAHRLWCSASNNKERFIAVPIIKAMQNTSDKELWLDIYVHEDELTTKGISHKQFLEESSLNFQEVKCEEVLNGRKLIRFEQVETISYSDRPSDKINDLVATIKDKLWCSVMSVPPYRKYYAHLCPNTESDHRLPQLASMYALFYYFSSVTRYRPNKFSEILTQTYGSFIREVIETIPNQFLYLLASEFSEQEVSKASIL